MKDAPLFTVEASIMGLTPESVNVKITSDISRISKLTIFLSVYLAKASVNGLSSLVNQNQSLVNELSKLPLDCTPI